MKNESPANQPKEVAVRTSSSVEIQTTPSQSSILLGTQNDVSVMFKITVPEGEQINFM